MIQRLKDALKKLRQRWLELRKKRHQAKPGGERREKLAKQYREAEKKKIAKAQELAKAIAERKKLSLKNVDCTSSPGEPHWGGAGDVMAQFVEPFMVKRGLPLGSGKRTPAHNAAIGGSPTSDHLTTKTTTDARDFPTYQGEDDAHALAKAMGASGWSANSYATFVAKADDRTFRVQILWGGSIGHGDHVHVGIS